MEILHKYIRSFKHLKGLVSKPNCFLASLLLFIMLINTKAFAGANAVQGDTQNQLDSRVLLKQQNSINPLVRILKRDYEFVFFYSTTCPHCMDFAPVLKLYSDNSGISVKAFVMDQGASSYFSNSVVISQEVVDQFFSKGAKVLVPILFILNKNNLHAYPVSSGALTYLELVSRMNDLAPKIIQHERNERSRV